MAPSFLSILVLLVASVASQELLDIILYGATGCVGHLAAAHLANQTNLTWAIAGRTKDAPELAALAAKLADAGGPSSKPETLIFSLDGTSDVKSFVQRAKAVATAAGPFSIHGGELLVKACAEAGVHYTDTSDEFYWQREMIDRHHATAEASGAKLVLSSGFCVLAGDLGAQRAISELPKGQEVAIDAWLETYNGGLSSGVIHTGKAIANASYPKEWDSDPYVLAPNVTADLRIDEIVEGIKYPAFIGAPEKEGIIVANIFGPYDARLLRRAFVQQGQQIKLRVGATPELYTKWAAFLAVHPKSWSSLTKCPAAPLLEGGSWQYRFIATTNASSSTVVLSGSGDPGYHFTAVGLAEAALCLAGNTLNCATSARGGIATASSATNARVLLDRLEQIGLVRVALA